MRHPHAIRIALSVSLLACATTSDLPASPPGVALESITVTSHSFEAGSPLPIDATCDGKGVSPDVTWSAPPEATQAIVVTLEDLEPGDGSGMRWLVLDVKPEARRLPPGVDPASLGALLGLNDHGEPSYRGPCPPRHLGHHFALRVFALDRPLGFTQPVDRDHVYARMNGHVLGSGALIGTVSR